VVPWEGTPEVAAGWRWQEGMGQIGAMGDDQGKEDGKKGY
jgi:hypothetical protein